MKKTLTACISSIFLGYMLLIHVQLSAQQEPQLSLYYLNPLLYNPAYTGIKNIHNVTLNTRFQWLGIKGAPMTQFVSYHGSLKNKNLGVGLVIENDFTGARATQGAFLNLAYSIQLNKKYHRLSWGMNFGLHTMQTNFSSLDVNTEDQADPLRINTLLISPNAGLGVYYMADKFYAGFSVPRLLSRTNGLLSSTQFRVFDPVFFLMGGYVFTLNENWKLKLNSNVKFQANTPIQFETGLSVCWIDKLNTGISYRFHESLLFSIMYKVSKKFYTGYVFDIPINGLALNQWGSHEFSLSYEWGKNLNKRKASSCFEF